MGAEKRWPDDIISAEMGIIHIPHIIEKSAVRLLSRRVSPLTVRITISGLSIVYQPIVLASPARRMTYLGIVA